MNQDCAVPKRARLLFAMSQMLVSIHTKACAPGMFGSTTSGCSKRLFLVSVSSVSQDVCWLLSLHCIDVFCFQVLPSRVPAVSIHVIHLEGYKSSSLYCYFDVGIVRPFVGSSRTVHRYYPSGHGSMHVIQIASRGPVPFTASPEMVHDF